MDIIYSWGKQLNHPGIEGQVFLSMFSIERLAIKMENDEKNNLHILRYEEVTLTYTWFNLNFTDQSSLFCGL